MGFFLPMPPVAGGATEKSWSLLSRALQKLGHDCTVLSRAWSNWPSDEVIQGVRHIRLPGFDHRRSLAFNLVNDARWSRRVLRVLPTSDVTISNAVTLPVWLGRHPNSGSVVVMPGRMPKGQFRWYGRVDRVLAVSETVETAVLQEKPMLGPVTRRFGYPITNDYFSIARSTAPNLPVSIGYVGRIHPEKGLDLLPDALALLQRMSDLPRWRFVMCGPSDVQRGGAGPQYVAKLEQKLVAAIGAERVEFRAPVFGDAELARVYSEIDLFCYPSLSTRGETFGLAVAEAMATGAVPVVSQLACFEEFVAAEENAETFDHQSSESAVQLANCLARLLSDPTRRAELSMAARQAVKRYHVNALSLQLSAEFSTLK